MNIKCPLCDEEKDHNLFTSIRVCGECGSQKPAPQGCWEVADGSGRPLGLAASAARRAVDRLKICIVRRG